jgi:hypothetical protein
MSDLCFMDSRHCTENLPESTDSSSLEVLNPGDRQAGVHRNNERVTLRPPALR